jgi:cell division protein FtsN
MSGDKGKVVAGVFIGMVLGIAAAGGVAWYVLNKKSAAFTAKEPVKAPAVVAPAPASAPVATVVTPPVAASGVGEDKQHFEFYKVLTDKSDGTAHKAQPQPKPAPKPKEPAPAPAVKAPQNVPSAAASKDKFFVQAGSFQNKDDAEKLKAKLAFSGLEANIHSADIPNKGTWYRVRLGPYGEHEAGKTIATLKQSGIIATQVHAQ